MCDRRVDAVYPHSRVRAPVRAPRELQALESRADSGRMAGDRETTQSDGGIEVVNKYQWLGNPRQGRFRVSVDGKSAGIAPLRGSYRGTVAPGSHSVRISLRRWYWSPCVDVDVPEGWTVVLEGDIDRSGSVFRRMAVMSFHPLSCMVLTVQAICPSDERMPDDRQSESANQAQRRYSRQVVLGALDELAGFALILVGVRYSWPVALVGLVLIVGGFVWTLRTTLARKRAVKG